MFGCAVLIALIISYALSPAIGNTRVVHGSALPVLWPGEMASAQFDRESVVRAFKRRASALEPSGWLVEPMPGVRGWWIRTRYQVFWWWLERYIARRPSLDVAVSYKWDPK